MGGKRLFLHAYELIVPLPEGGQLKLEAPVDEMWVRTWSVSVPDFQMSGCQERGYQLLIFDWDGTLVDSGGRIVTAMHLAADSSELPRCTDEQVRGIIGLGFAGGYSQPVSLAE